MKIICNQSVLNNVLNTVSRVVPSRPSHPVLLMLKFVATNNIVAVTGYDLTLGIMAKMNAEVINHGSICLPASLLHDIIAKMPNSSDICLEVTDDICLISCGQGQYKIKGMSDDEFPDLPTIDDGREIKLSSDVFLEGLKNTLMSSSLDETKQVLTGINLATKEENLLKFAGTDGHRLSVTSFGLEDEDGVSFNLTIPRKTLAEIQKLLSTKKYEEIEICFKDNQVLFKLLNDFLIVSRILDGNYPNYEQLIPSNFSNSLTIDRKELLTTIDRVSVLADSKNNVIKWEIDVENQTTKISVNTPDVGSGSETLATQNSGVSMSIAFNGKYLIDCLKTFSSNEVQVCMNAPGSAAVFKPLGAISALYLIMPVQLRD